MVPSWLLSPGLLLSPRVSAGREMELGVGVSMCLSSAGRRSVPHWSRKTGSVRKVPRLSRRPTASGRAFSNRSTHLLTHGGFSGHGHSASEESQAFTPVDSADQMLPRASPLLRLCRRDLCVASVPLPSWDKVLRHKCFCPSFCSRE